LHLTAYLGGASPVLHIRDSRLWWGVGTERGWVNVGGGGKSDTKVSELCKELGMCRQTLYRHVSPDDEARPDGMRVFARKQGGPKRPADAESRTRRPSLTWR